MNEIVVKRHSFDMAKNRLKEFSEKTEAELKIDKVETKDGFLGLGDHKVTGYELNERLETIQEHLIDANAINNKVIKVFREIYNALDALDKVPNNGNSIFIPGTDNKSFSNNSPRKIAPPATKPEEIILPT